MSGAQRGRLLYRLAELLEQDRETMVQLESMDAGKPLAATRRQDLPAAIDCLRYYAGWADKLEGQVVSARSDALTYVLREAVGVVGAIVPWNFPLMNAVWKIAPALACGCTIVLKPAELTPLSALRLGELALLAGLPEGVLNIVPGFGTEAGEALIRHPGVDKIAFTGSPQVRQAHHANRRRGLLSASRSNLGANRQTSFSLMRTSQHPSKRRPRASFSTPVRFALQAREFWSQGLSTKILSVHFASAPRKSSWAIPLSPVQPWVRLSRLSKKIAS